VRIDQALGHLYESERQPGTREDSSMIRRRVLRSCAGAILTGVLAGCTENSAVAPPANVLIVTLDTTRADRLSAYGFQSASMPAIDRLARDGILFQRATTVAPLTLPAHCSLLTGLYPRHHGVRDNADPPLDPTHRTLAEILHGRGFQTAAFVAASVLASDRGLSRGFDVYRDTTTSSDGGAPHNVRRPANEVIDDALTWLNGHEDSRFFVWMHLYDAHAPYRTPEPYRTRHSADPYEGSLVFVDAQVDRVIRWLESHRQLSRTLIVVAGDHGESLGDHGELEHGIFLYESTLHVPLIMRVPGVAPRRLGAITSLVDVMPTVLGLLRLPGPPVDGLDLTPALGGAGEPTDRLVYSESLFPERFGWSALRAVRDGRFKLIDAPRPELYDLETDPFEERNLYTPGSATATALARRLEAFDALQGVPGSGPTDRVSADVRARLRTLGYIGGDARSAGSTRRDPKDYIATYNAMRLASRSASR
jgi:choline-sulfatase